MSKTKPRDARSHVLRRRLRGQAPGRLQRRPTTKTPRLGLETPARTYCGGDFVARLLNDFSGGDNQAPVARPRDARSYALRRRLVARLLNDFSDGDFVARLLNDFSGGQRPRLRGQAPERLQRRPTTKTPWLGLETPACTYHGGDFADRLLNDFRGGQ